MSLGEHGSESRAENQGVFTPRPRRNLSLFALCGAIAPIFFGLMVIVEGFVVPGYNWVSQFVSDLGAYSLYGSYAILQTLNFWVFGALVVVFALGLRGSVLGSRGVMTSLALFGIMGALAGVFADQPYPFPGDAHLFVSGVAFTSIILCEFLVWSKLRHAGAENAGGDWSVYSNYSLASGILTVALSFLIGAFGTNYQGLMVRLFMLVPWLWIEVVALRILRLSRTSN